jgi:elongation factor G
MESKPAVDHVKAQAPMEKMFGFMTALRSVSQGRASFSMEFSHFEKKILGRNFELADFSPLKVG